jgi:hypothetical protein
MSDSEETPGKPSTTEKSPGKEKVSVEDECIASMIGPTDRLVMVVSELTRRAAPTAGELAKVCEILCLLNATAISVIAVLDSENTTSL